MKRSSLSLLLQSAAAASMLSVMGSTAHAAIYYASITSGTQVIDTYVPPPETTVTTDLTGNYIKFEISDDFQEQTVCHGYGGCETDSFKKITFLDGYRSGTTAYSRDGTVFRHYNAFGLLSEWDLVINFSGSTLTYKYDSTASTNAELTNFVSTVPVPPAFGLFGSALAGLGASRLARRKK